MACRIRLMSVQKAPSFSKKYRKAFGYYRKGRLSEAEAIGRELVDLRPNNAHGWHLLGLVATAAGDYEAAHELIERALDLQPENPDFLNTQGETCRRLQRTGAALEHLYKAVELRPDFPEALNNLGMVLTSCGYLGLAEEHLQRALESRPGFVEAQVNLARVFHQRGQWDECVALLSAALESRPDMPLALYCLASAMSAQGRLQESVAYYRQVLAQNANYHEAHLGLACILHRMGEHGAAESHYVRALALHPDYPEALNSLACLMTDLGRTDEAKTLFHKALGVQKEFLEAELGLAGIYQREGQPLKAIEHFQQALAVQPDQPEVCYTLGYLMHGLGRLDEAKRNFQQAIDLREQYAEAELGLAVVCHRLQEPNHALAHYQKALAARPDYPEAYNSMGLLLQRIGYLEESKEALEKALELKPDFPEAYNNLGNVYKDQGRLDKALECFREAVRLNPDLHVPNSNVLMTMHYDVNSRPEDIEAAHRAWGERIATRYPVQDHDWSNDRNPDRPLRVGLVSPDFFKHAVAYFLKDIVEALDPGLFKLYFYAGNAHEDEMTERLKNSAACWRRTVSMSDAALAEQVRKDRIDILVDVSGHTAENRLLMFARKPAPIQVTWLGYPNSSGLGAIDYRLTDAVADPPGSPDWHSEQLYCLPEGFLCFGEPADSPPVAAPPSVENGFITFGSFNNNAKITPRVTELWAELLERVPDSRLLIKNDALRSPGARAAWLEQFKAHGIGEERLQLVLRKDHYVDHLALYNQVDIALDVFPYNGTTTTCEAMWMGVPVVVLRGNRHVSRVGASLLTRVGLEDLIAEDEAAYVEKAVSLAADQERLVQLHQELRGRMQGCALGDGARFARTLEHAFREMWQNWLSSTDS